LKSHIHLQKPPKQPLPPAFRDDDVRYPESLVECFLEEYTQAGDTILDPFAGFGTTLIVAERMGRVPFGVEINKDKVNYVRGKLARPESIIQGDSRLLADIGLPAIDFSMTSPPYMTRDDPDDPFTDYQARGQGYRVYLRDIRSIYEQLRKHMKPSGIVILEVANLKRDGQVTTLAWDIGRVISQVLHFEGEVIACWDEAGSGYDHSYCLVFSVR
jgi:hypothetical protein